MLDGAGGGGFSKEVSERATKKFIPEKTIKKDGMQVEHFMPLGNRWFKNEEQGRN